MLRYAKRWIRRWNLILCAIVLAIGLSSSLSVTTQCSADNNINDNLIAISSNDDSKNANAESTFVIDANHSLIGFSVRHLTISNVHGRFAIFSGTIHYNEQDVTKSSVEFNAKAESIDTGVKPRDEHLRTADFFDVAKYPDITFKSTKIAQSGGQYQMTGNFTMHGVTKEITFPFQLTKPIKDPRGNTRFGIEAEFTINRQDYGINYGKTFGDGSLVVSNDVKINLNMEASKQEPAKEQPATK